MQAAIERAQLSAVFTTLPASMIVALLLAAVTAAVLWPSMSHAALLGWWSAMLLLTAARFYLYKRYTAQSSNGWTTARLARAFRIGACAAGALWGCLCVLLFPSAMELRVFIAFVLAGGSAGAVSALGADRKAAYGFILFCLLPLAIQLLLHQSALSLAMSVMVLLYIGMLGVSINRTHRQLIALITANSKADAHLRVLGETQAQLERLNDRLLVATRAGKVGVWEWDLRTNRIYWDEQLYRMYGLSGDAVIDLKTWRSRVHPEDLVATEAAWERTIQHGQDFEVQFRVVMPSGSERHLQSAAIVQRSADGTAIRVVGMNTDISELKKVAQMKTEFVSTASHELRTPLTSITGALQLLQNDAIGSLNPRSLRLVEMAARNAARLSTLVESMLAFSQLELDKENFAIAGHTLEPLLRRAIEQNASFAQERAVAYASRCESNLRVMADADKLVNVIAELLHNAVKFSPPHSQVEIVASSSEQGACLEIIDHGSGIAPEFQERVFTEFAQQDSSDSRAEGGFGLGLALAKSVVEKMRGTIMFSSHVGQGTIFRVVLPVPSDR